MTTATALSIVVLESDPGLRWTLASLLEASGHGAWECATREELGELLGAKPWPDAVIVDAASLGDAPASVLPGPDSLDEMIVVVTSSDVRPPSLAGYPFVPKPFRVEEVLELIERLRSGEDVLQGGVERG